MIQSVLLLVLLNVLALVSIAKAKPGVGKILLISFLVLTDLFYLCNLPKG